jgi:hypothetical protein
VFQVRFAGTVASTCSGLRDSYAMRKTVCGYDQPFLWHLLEAIYGYGLYAACDLRRGRNDLTHLTPEEPGKIPIGVS